MPQPGQRLLNSAESWSKASGSNAGSWYASLIDAVAQQSGDGDGGSSAWTTAEIAQVLAALTAIRANQQAIPNRQPRYAVLSGGNSWDISAQANSVLSVAIAWSQVDPANTFEITDAGGTIAETSPGAAEWGNSGTAVLQPPLSFTANGSAIARIAWEEQV